MIQYLVFAFYEDQDPIGGIEDCIKVLSYQDNRQALASWLEDIAYQRIQVFPVNLQLVRVLPFGYTILEEVTLSA